MRLSPQPERPRDFAAADVLLDAHLSPTSAAPLAVAYSGGGDSLALLLAVAAWSRPLGRRVIVLHVDHGLQAASGAWVEHCRQTAEALGLPFQALAWTGDKPERGLPAAARAARHSLLAQAARAKGARVLLMGHTADDVLEARQMRRDGATTPEPRPWGPSPAWPEGRDLFILRPLLRSTRADLRAHLRRQPLTWIEDPANLDPTYARSRARAHLAQTPSPMGEPAARAADLRPLARIARHDATGTIVWDRRAVRSATSTDLARMVAVACLCAAGGVRPPRRGAVDRIVTRLAADGDFVATLAGARIVADSRVLQVSREAGEAARGGLATVTLAPGVSLVWDGRFEVVSDHPGWSIGPLAGRMSALAPASHQALRSVLPALRRALPALISPEGEVVLAAPGIAVQGLVQARFDAASGLIAQEPNEAAD
ncbi:tRNA lysidine(34) synthetase TilS [Phenylobacterium sp.]|uniref:tRNA lysidine(34) synthetase TilS n=1 Tax=Phenylobacterium sp. TaxID=1871053 RepID=UPI0027312FDA|nr:tRNA lysidine(34) synthetase TilS [Phenylobacterium sp.]MDP2214249.1 tRNA lysidine(34) synthetase TilS [Phenylobacterium sp.]